MSLAYPLFSLFPSLRSVQMLENGYTRAYHQVAGLFVMLQVSLIFLRIRTYTPPRLQIAAMLGARVFFILFFLCNDYPVKAKMLRLRSA